MAGEFTLALFGGLLAAFTLALAYLWHINRLLKGIPPEVQELTGPRWTAQELKETYRELEENPIDYTDKLPMKLDRRYVVVGGNGLVGGFIVLQLLARGTPPNAIRILDLRKSQRNDMSTGVAATVEFISTDIRSSSAVTAAFAKPWHPSIAQLPLTVFHTAAVILASDRSKFLYALPEQVNVQGTANVLKAAQAAGADVFSSTSSASIIIRPLWPWVPFWANEPRGYFQLMDEQDFNQPLRPRSEFFGNYPYSKAVAERLVCTANCDAFRTGCIRPANGVYGNPTDNAVGGPLSRSVQPTWIPHITNSFVHAANVSIAHLQHEAVLTSKKHVKNIPQAGRPFVVTDPNPPITFGDLYLAISTLSIYPFRTMLLPPALLLVLSYLTEWTIVLPHRCPALKRFLPDVKGDARSLQPGIFSICKHLIASDAEIRKPVTQGGLGYQGVLTTMQGMVWEILEWNQEHTDSHGETIETKTEADKTSNANKLPNGRTQRRMYTSSVAVAEQLRQVMAGAST